MNRRQKSEVRLFVICSLSSVFCLLSFFACQKASEPPPVKKEIKIVAVINDEKITENILIERLVANKYKGSFDVSDKEIDSYFKSNLKDFVKPLKVHVLQIVVKNEEEALNVRSELLSGKDFEKIAREKSIGFEAEKGGDLGFFIEGQMPQEFDNTIFKLKVGEISHPVKTSYGYHIFKLIERKEPKKVDPAEAKENIRRILIKEKYGEALKKLLASLRENAKIEIYEDRI